MDIAAPADFNHAFAQQWQTAADKKQLLSVLLCEIDYYPEYVEHYGIQGASFMLISIALSLKNICEKNHCLLSYNEQHGFTILAKGTTAVAVQAIGERLCEVVANAKTEHKHTQVNDFITLSVGISSLFPTTKSMLQNNAKNALNEAKIAGGNNVNSPSSMAAKSEPKVYHAATNETQNIEEKSETENQKMNTQKHDIFAPQETQLEKDVPKETKTYRGQIIENSQRVQPQDALKSNKAALDEGDIDTTTKNIKNKKKAVRMYRGQIVTD
ncbi:GGDEF domain-containing protein [Psychromonas marina]|nr:GGDEF domain-containing protein [Psychromonas marina]